MPLSHLVDVGNGTIDLSARPSNRVAGRVGTLCEVMGDAAMRSASEGFLSETRKPANQDLLRLLFEIGPLSNRDLGKRLGLAEATVCRKLRPLEDERVVVPVRRGRERLNTLSETARGHLQATFVGTEERNGRYDMSTLRADAGRLPEGTHRTLPRISGVLAGNSTTVGEVVVGW